MLNERGEGDIEKRGVSPITLISIHARIACQFLLKCNLELQSRNNAFSVYSVAHHTVRYILLDVLFGKFPQPVGHYCSYLLPKQSLATRKENQNKILRTRRCATLYIAQRLLFRLNRGWMFSAVVRDCALKSVVTSKSS